MLTVPANLAPIERDYEFSHQPQHYNVLRAQRRIPPYDEYRGDYYRTGSFSVPETPLRFHQPSGHATQNFYSDNFYQRIPPPYEPRPHQHPSIYSEMTTDNYQRNVGYVPHHDTWSSYHNINPQQTIWLNPPYMSSAYGTGPDATGSSSTNDWSGLISDSTAARPSVPISPFSSISPTNEFRQTTFGTFVPPIVSNLDYGASAIGSNQSAAQLTPVKQFNVSGGELSSSITPVKYPSKDLASSMSNLTANRSVAIVSPRSRVSPYAVMNTRKPTARSATKSKASGKSVSTRKSVIIKKSDKYKSSEMLQSHAHDRQQPYVVADEEYLRRSSQQPHEYVSNRTPVSPAVLHSTASINYSAYQQSSSELVIPPDSLNQTTTGHFLHSPSHLSPTYNSIEIQNIPTTARSTATNHYLHSPYTNPSESNWTDILRPDITQSRDNYDSYTSRTVEMPDPNTEFESQGGNSDFSHSQHF